MSDRGKKLVRRGLDVAGAALLAVVVLAGSLVGLGGLPALGSVLNPGTGVWRLSADADAAGQETDSLPGLHKPATVAFEQNGLAHVHAEDDSDLFRTIGYVHARFRLFQMDLARRQASGTLAEIVGPDAVESDRFERDLGLRRAAERDWAQLPADSPVRATLVSYTEGVNAAIHQLTDSGRLPTQFTVLDYRPADWSAVDTLAVQRLVGQKISYDDQGVLMSYAANALPPKVFHDWFPDVPANEQHPYDKGPYVKRPLAPLPVGTYPDVPGEQGQQGGGQAIGAPARPGSQAPPATAAAISKAMSGLRLRLDSLPEGAVNAMGHSNSWVISGSKTESGKPLLSADPHLPYSLPSIWYQLEGSSPGYHFSGVTTPGIPVPLLGKTDRFAWGLTAAQRPTTLYYLERTDPARPDQYYWKGAWHRMTVRHEPIKVRGAATEDHQVRLTAHGPIMEVEGVSVAVWWAGTLPSDNLGAMLKLLRATSIQQFRASLTAWATPALNFSYADPEGNIGMFNIGVAPQVRGHDPALPLPGDGSADVAGTIPDDALPAAINPPEGYLVSANQREVTGDYPYQYSTSYNYPEKGWRDGEVVHDLDGLGKVSLAESSRLQNDWHDNNARQLVPLLLRALRDVPLNADEQRIVDLLAHWDYAASPDAPQPAFFDSFKNRVSWVTFEPWWTKYHVGQNPGGYLLPKTPDSGAWANETLRGTVLAWLQHDPDNPYFSLPDGTHRTGKDVLVTAFRQSVKHTYDKYGPDIAKWRYDRTQSVLFPSLMGVSALDIGPFPWGGNPRTINASVGTRDDANGNPLSNLATAGPTWRFGIDWGTGEVHAVYPGGQSENPMSPWYGNGVPVWLGARYWPVLEGPAAEKVSLVRWQVTP